MCVVWITMYKWQKPKNLSIFIQSHHHYIPFTTWQKKMGVFDHILLMSGSNARQFRKEKRKNLKMQFRVLIFTIIICQPLLEATERRGLTLVTHSYRLHSICSSLLLYVQSNFTDTPVSKYVCQSQTLTHPFKTLLSQSFTPELFTGPLGPFDLLSSNLSFQFNYKNPPSLPACHLPCGTAESVNSSV